MPAHRSLLLRADVLEAGKQCRCKHDRKHAIPKGELRLLVKEPGPGTPEYGYCAVCGREMLATAQEQVAELQADLA